MNIECKLKRDGGSKIDLGGIEYHFAPVADGAHVADVEEDEHIARFLAIPEGYRIYKDQPAAPKKESQVASTAEADNAEGDAGPADEHADLVAKYEAKFSKKPHHRMTDESIRAALDVE